MPVKTIVIREKITEILNELPVEKMAEVLDFATFVKERSQPPSGTVHRLMIKTVPAEQLRSLTGIVAWDGDALADTERLYE